MIQITSPSDCCGCTACASVCAHNAITMQPDALGFLYPTVDTDKCTECGLCEKVCAFHDKYDKSLNLPEPIAYGARHKRAEEVETSRSGAAFIAMSDYVLQRGGVVYGAGYTDHFRVTHKRAVTKEQRNEFKGSKYVESDLKDTFRQVKKDLREGLTVLFSGTPCQTAGLHSFIGDKLRANLILVDIVCHGVPSPYIWRDYIKQLEEEKKGEVVYVDFREKQQCGWRAHKEAFRFEGCENEKVIRGSFTYLFYKHIIFRHSCGACKYTNLQRPSDITIADFWGWEKTHPTINADDKGLSLVICNTGKGEQLFEAIKEEMNVIPAKIQDCMQPSLRHPSKIHRKREDFELDYMHKGFTYVMKRYGDMGWRYQVEKHTAKIIRAIKRTFGKK